MAEVTKERKGQIQQAVLEVLKQYPDGRQAKDVIAEVSARLVLSPFEESTYPSSPNVQRFDKIVRFSTIGPVKAGWITKEKGTWAITDVGCVALKEFSDPITLNAEASRLYRAWRKEQPIGDNDENSEEEEPNSTNFEEAEENAWNEIRDYLASMNPYDFQELVGGLLQGMGYHVSWISPPGPDKGIDILAHTDPLGFEGPRIKVQVKRTPESRIASSDMRSFMATLGTNDVGLYVASGGFTRDAEKEAREQENRRITLIDLQDLVDLWIKHYEDIPEKERILLPLRPIHYLAPEN